MKKCNYLQKKLKEVGDANDEYKEMSKDVEAFAVNESSLIACWKGLFRFRFGEEEHTVYVAKTKRDTSHRTDNYVSQ